MVSRAASWMALSAVLACARTASPPDEPDESSLGRCSAGIDRALACGEWSDAVEACGGDADSHTTFPELTPEGCMIRVHYEDGALPRAGEVPAGCGYPQDRAATVRHLRREAARHEAIARGLERRLPMTLDCGLPRDALATAAATNGRTFRALARRLDAGEGPFAYAAASTFGFGHPVMGDSKLVDWRPGDACAPLDKREMWRLSINIVRAARASAAYHGGVAPVASFSGGAVHAPLHEAFMHMHLATCLFGVPPDAVLLDPCADHTHTNLRNTGSLVLSLGGRTAYVVTDDGLQSGYLQDSTVFWLVGGDIDQRSLRDWGYLLGSWRQASVGMRAGFWFTPFRFWNESRDGLDHFTCSR